MEQLVDVEKWELITWNLGQIFKSVQDQVMDGWSATVLDECLQRQIDKKIFKLKIKACPVNTDHCMAFKHSIWFETYLAANFGCNWFRITPDIISKLLRAAIRSLCAVLFESEQAHPKDRMLI